jgi:signal transduction histidine kinase
VFIFERNRHKHRQEKALLKSQYEKEILQSQIEVQNSTLKYIGQELHDNIGQLLSVTKINLGVMEEALAEKNYDEFAFNFHQANDLVTEIINEVRGLSKSLDDNFVQEFGLTESIAHELHRIRKTRKFTTDFVIQGEKYALGFEREIVLFRIMQEVFNNALKHSGAEKLEIGIQYNTDSITLIVGDNGKGFDYEEVMNKKISESGAGLRNIKRRAALIDFTCELTSLAGKGTKYILTSHKTHPVGQ